MDVDEAVDNLLNVCRDELVEAGNKKGVTLVWDVSFDYLAGESLTCFSDCVLMGRYQTFLSKRLLRAVLYRYRSRLFIVQL